MKENIKNLLDTCLQEATDDDLHIIYQLLKGVERKQKGHYESYISAILQMEREIKEQHCDIIIPINSLTDNSLNIVHGGITATILDSAMGTLANTILPEGFGAVTSNLSIHYIAPGIGAELRASAKVLHKGTKTLVVEGSVHRDDGKKIAHCTGTFFIVNKKPVS